MWDGGGGSDCSGEETILAGGGFGESRPGLDGVVVWGGEEVLGPRDGLEVFQDGLGRGVGLIHHGGGGRGGGGVVLVRHVGLMEGRR